MWCLKTTTTPMAKSGGVLAGSSMIGTYLVNGSRLSRVRRQLVSLFLPWGSRWLHGWVLHWRGEARFKAGKSLVLGRTEQDVETAKKRMRTARPMLPREQSQDGNAG